MVLLIWTRKGFLVPLITFIILLLTQLLVDAIAGKGIYSISIWAAPLAIAISGLVCGLLGLYLNKNTKTKKVYIEKATGKEVLLDRSHKFFFIKFEYWGIILIIIALAFLLLNFFTIA